MAGKRAVSGGGYGQFCPVALAAEVLAQRWTLLVIRELLLGSTRFNDLQRGVPRMSPALLARRLRELQFTGLVERRRGNGGAAEYRATQAGRELFPVIEGMGSWAQRWLRHRQVDTGNLDPDLLMWDIRRTVRDPGLRAGRYVVAFQLSGVPVGRRCYWLVFERDQVDLCYRDPGFEIDLFVAGTLRTLTQIWLNHVGIEQALRDRRLRLEGPRRDVSAFRRWFALSVLASGRPPMGAVQPDAQRRAGRQAA